jgi:CRP-like cAMP-binding protein
MPKPLQYRSGSLIYFQGDAADKIFILQNGKVSLVYQDIETGEDVRDQVQPGEFFGVKSALGRYPREENAVALSDSTIMAFTVQEFEALAQANTRIIMKMLKVFSNQMRRLHSQVSSLMAKEDAKPDEGLYNVGEYYLKNKRYSQAKYVFGRYLTYYPSGRRAIQASKNLETAEISLARYGDGKGPAVMLSSGTAEPPSRPADTGWDIKTSGPEGVTKSYYDAVSLVSQGKYQEAFSSFKAIVDANEDPEWTARSSFEIGRCLFMMNKFEECLKYYTSMFTKYPRHPDIKDAMFIMGQCNQKLGRKDQAAAFYKKILSMSAGDDDGSTTKVKRALNALEG